MNVRLTTMTLLKSLCFIFWSMMLWHPSSAWALDNVGAYLPKEITFILLGGSLLGLAICWWWFQLGWQTRRLRVNGLEVISSTVRRRFIPFPKLPKSMEFIAREFKSSGLRFSGGLNRVELSEDKQGNVVLEDRNERSMVLHNRRRLEQIKLSQYDVLDLGEITLMYYGTDLNADKKGLAFKSGSALQGIAKETLSHDWPMPDIANDHTEKPVVTKVYFRPLRVPTPKQAPSLVSMRDSNQVFFITKNVVFVGSSDTNDLVLKSPDVELRHAKLERVSDRYRLVQLSSRAYITINRRRVEQGYLKAGDEVFFEGTGFVFQAETSINQDSSKTASTKTADTKTADTKTADNEKQPASPSGLLT